VAHIMQTFADIYAPGRASGPGGINGPEDHNRDTVRPTRDRNAQLS
jgi:hypothetical protein